MSNSLSALREAVKRDDGLPACDALEVLDELESARAENARLRAALAPFAHFADVWDRYPIRGLSDELYGIHGEAGAKFRLSDCKQARAALEEDK